MRFPWLASLCSLVPVAAAAAQGISPPLEAALVVFGDEASIDATGDFNGDGHVDGLGWYYMFAPAQGATLRAYLGDGSGTFERAPWGLGVNGSRWTGTFPWTLQVGDLDGDSMDDFVVSLESLVRAYRGDASGILTEYAGWDEPEAPESAALADVDGDGLDDLVFAGAGGLRLFRNTGSGFSLDSVVPGTAADVRRAEVNGDGVADLFYNVGDRFQMLTFRGGQLVPAGSYVHGVQPNEMPMTVVGDVDNDGDEDIVVFTKDSEYVTVRRTAAAAYTVEPRAPGGPATGLADIDGDGDLDGVCCGGGGPTPAHNSTPSIFHIAMNLGGGRFAGAWQLGGLGAKRLGGAVDVDEDGDLDLVAGRCIFFNNDTFAVEPQPPVAAPTTYGVPLRLVDLDRDGDDDVLQSASASFLRNDGDGRFAASPLVLPAAAAGTAYEGPGYRGDFDADGDVDLIMGHVQFSPRSILGMRLLLNNGGGGFTDAGYAAPPGVNFSMTTGLFEFGKLAAAGDVDNDGDVDIAVGHDVGLSVVLIWLNDGHGFFTRGANVVTGPPHALIDMNGDGNVDLVANSSTAIAVHYGGGNGEFRGYGGFGFQQGVLRHVDHMAIADINADGLLDFVMADGISDEVAIWEQHPDKTFSKVRLPAPLSYLSKGGYYADALDLNGDGHLDIVAGPPGYGPTASYVWLADGQGGFPTRLMQVVASRGTADVDGDGDVDLLGDRVVRNNTYRVPRDGRRLRYGSGRNGLGGMAPQLGAVGPFRVGERVDLRLRGAVGGTLAALAVGTGASALQNFPWPGVVTYVDPIAFAVGFPTNGAAGQAGAGAADLSFVVPPAVAGAALCYQAFCFDASVGPMRITHTGGLDLQFGQ